MSTKATKSKKLPAVHARNVPPHHEVRKVVPPAPEASPAEAAPPRKVIRRVRKLAGVPPQAVPLAGAPPATATTTTPVTPLILAPPAVVDLPATYDALVVQPPQYDPTAGAAAFTALAANRAAIPADKVLVSRVDVQAASLVALGAYGFIGQVPVLHAQLQAMDGAGLFLMSTLSDLQTAALAALYAFSMAETAGAFNTGTLVPAALLSEATAVEKRMQARCEYVFANDPTVAPLLDMLRPGTGYSDLANDLLGYASIYAANTSQIVATNDPNYVTTDLADAKTYAGQIFAYLTAAMGPAARSAYDDLEQSWTLLLEIYGEVRAVALALLRFDPKAGARFPSLTSAARAKAVPKKKVVGAATNAATPVATVAAGTPAATAAGTPVATAAPATPVVNGGALVPAAKPASV